MHDRVKGSSDAGQNPASDVIANVALVLNVAAIVAFAICVGQAGHVSQAVAASIGFIAVCCFAASLVCFAADSSPARAPQGGTAPAGSPVPYPIGGAE